MNAVKSVYVLILSLSLSSTVSVIYYQPAKSKVEEDRRGMKKKQVEEDEQVPSAATNHLWRLMA